jgi:hypothetical protein
VPSPLMPGVIGRWAERLKPRLAPPPSGGAASAIIDGVAGVAGVAEATQRARQRIRLFLLLMAALVIVMTLPLPFRLAGIAFAAAAIVMAIRSLAALAVLRRLGVRSRGQVGISLGLGMAGVLLLFLAAELAYYPVVADFERCSAGANTRTAQQACEQSSQRRLDEILDRLRKMSGTSNG